MRVTRQLWKKLELNTARLKTSKNHLKKLGQKMAFLRDKRNNITEGTTMKGTHSDIQDIARKQKRHGLIKRSNGLTQNRVRELFLYESSSGELIRKIKTSNSTRQGEVAGGLNKNGYYYVMVDGIRYGYHQIVFLYHHGFLPEGDIDHIDRDSKNNKIENLREVSVSCNMKNSKIRSTNSSGITGVSYSKSDNKWNASIMNKGQVRWLGRYFCKVEAACARLAAEECLDWDWCDRQSTARAFVELNLKR